MEIHYYVFEWALMKKKKYCIVILSIICTLLSMNMYASDEHISKQMEIMAHQGNSDVPQMQKFC